MSNLNRQPNYNGAFATVTSLFFLWGFLTVFVDPIVPWLQEVFELSYFESGIAQFAFFSAYGLVSIPAGFLLSRTGYKKGILIGLAAMCAGSLLVWLAAEVRGFPVFLGALFVIASGMTILQVAANPYIAVLGPARSASTRMNLAQAFNSLGTTIAPILGATFILNNRIKTTEEIEALPDAEKLAYYASEAEAIQMPYLMIALSIAALFLMIRFIKLPEVLNPQTSKGGYREALKNKRLMFGAIGIFLYVGAEVTFGTYLTKYILSMDLKEPILENGFTRWLVSLYFDDLAEVDAKGIAGTFVTFFWGGAMVGRFVGAWLTSVWPPARVLTAFGVLAFLFTCLSMIFTGFVAMWAIIAVGLFNSIMFPTIFTLAIADLGELKPQGSGILCTAIVGGAAIPPLYGLLTDNYGFKSALLLVMGCYTFILIYGWLTSSNKLQTN